MITIGPGPYELTLTQSVGGAVILRQTQDNVIMIPAEHVRALALSLAACVQQLVPE